MEKTHIEILSKDSDADVYDLEIKYNGYVIEIITNLLKTNYCLVLHELHIDGPGNGKIGLSGIKQLLVVLGKEFDKKEVIVFGAKRTTGANIGKKPKPLRFKVI